MPCGDCTACCRSSYFIDIGPEETGTLARIPKELQFPAPGKPGGNVVLGFDEHGCCPMLVDAKCSIYAHRPLTCRSYDCRIFAATGIALTEDDKALVTQHTQRWRFSYPSKRDRDQHAALKTAAMFLHEHPECLRGEEADNSTELALRAMEIYDVFLTDHGKSSPPTDGEVVNAVMRAKQKFDGTT